MKTLIAFLMATFSMTPVFAQATRYGSRCGLTDAKNKSWQKISTRELSGLTDGQIRALPTLTKQQLIITAKWFAKDEIGAPSSFADTVEAVRYLETAEGLSLTHYLVRGQKYTEVLCYPGDTGVGLIFEQGKTHVVAYNSDDDITCYDAN